MSTTLQVEVSDEIGKMVSLRAKEFGVSLNSFVGEIIGNFLRNDEYDISGFRPNEETLAAFAEYRDGTCREYDSVEELLADIKND